MSDPSSATLARARVAALAGQSGLFLRALRMIAAAAPRWTSGWAALTLAQGLVPLALVYLTKRAVDALAAPAEALPAVALLVSVYALGEVIAGAAAWVRTGLQELLQDRVMEQIHRRAIDADFGLFETPAFFDHLHRAREEATYRPALLLETVGGLAQSGITALAMAAVLASFRPWIPLLLIAGSLPAAFVLARVVAENYYWRRVNTEHERRSWYFDWLVTARDTAAEIRLFGLGQGFAAAYQRIRSLLRSERLRAQRRRGLAEGGAAIAALAVVGITLAQLLSDAATGRIGMGDLALYLAAFLQGMRLMQAGLKLLADLYINSLFLRNLFELLDLRPTIRSPQHPIPFPRPVRDGIRFESVTFRYPGAAQPVLDGFNLHVPAGGVIALVGRNGAGKSTMLKLMCRFYDVDEGRITIDGVPLPSFALDELRNNVSVLFQTPVRYSHTAAENIAFGREGAPEELRAAAAAAGADGFLDKLPQGYDTLLGTWFSGGTDLSVGQWQRLALARAFRRAAPVLVLDEPTSALDPWAEAAWFDRFRALAKGRTAIVVTHRFTTAMRADWIAVMDQGRIVETGDHAALMRRDGLYARGWDA